MLRRTREHLAEDLTLRLLRQVMAQAAGRPLAVAVTYRPADAGDELQATIAALLTSTAAHLRLAGLDPAAVTALARAHGLTEAGPEQLAMVAERTGGNPLFMRELRCHAPRLRAGAFEPPNGD